LANLMASRKQTVTLDLPAHITHFTVKKGDATIQKGNTKNCLIITLPTQQEVILEIETDS